MASLVGFEFDSAIEVSAALILTWRLAREHCGGCMQATDPRATRAIALDFVVLGIYVGYGSLPDLLQRSWPDASLVGIAMAGLSLW